MSAIAVRAEHLSKQYRIGPREPYRALRDAITDALYVPWRAVTSGLNGRRPASSPAGYIWALKDVSFEVKQGEVVGIIGRNGAGKTTLLKILSRITGPTAGRVEIWGRVGSLLEVGTGFHPEMTGRENLYLNGAILGMKRREIDRKFEEIVSFAEIEKFLDTPVKRYSSGMYMRLAFAVAAHLEPEILLVDEVLAVGDAVFQKKCVGKMEELAGEGRTVLFVSHHMTSIVQLCSTAIWLESSGIADHGEARSVVARYLRENRVPLGEVQFDPAGGSTGVALVRAYVMDDRLQIRPDIPYERPFNIAFEYSVQSPVDGLRVGFRLYNERQQAVLHTATSDCPSLDGAVGRAGRHRAWVQIPGALLAPGRYYAELGIWSPDVGHHQHVSDALAFDIAGANVDSVGEEVLRPVLDWTVE